jgi:hypothetical protein
VVVVENGAHRGRVTKVARRYLTVEARHRRWEFDKITRRCRGDHGGYVPHLFTATEHAVNEAWGALRGACSALPFSTPAAGEAVAGAEKLIIAAAAVVDAVRGNCVSDGVQQP